MKVCVTIRKPMRVGRDMFKDFAVSKVFDSSDSLDKMISWAMSKGTFTFHNLEFSEIDEKEISSQLN